jgi:hypothetical protein
LDGVSAQLTNNHLFDPPPGESQVFIVGSEKPAAELSALRLASGCGYLSAKEVAGLYDMKDNRFIRRLKDFVRYVEYPSGAFRVEQQPGSHKREYWLIGVHPLLGIGALTRHFYPRMDVQLDSGELLLLVLFSSQVTGLEFEEGPCRIACPGHFHFTSPPISAYHEQNQQVRAIFCEQPNCQKLPIVVPRKSRRLESIA